MSGSVLFIAVFFLISTLAACTQSTAPRPRPSNDKSSKSSDRGAAEGDPEFESDPEEEEEEETETDFEPETDEVPDIDEGSGSEAVKKYELTYSINDSTCKKTIPTKIILELGEKSAKYEWTIDYPALNCNLPVYSRRGAWTGLVTDNNRTTGYWNLVDDVEAGWLELEWTDASMTSFKGKTGVGQKSFFPTTLGTMQVVKEITP